MRVFDLIRSRQDVYSIGEETTAYEAARYLRDHQVRSVGVLDAARKLSGYISYSDISDKVAAENKCPLDARDGNHVVGPADCGSGISSGAMHVPDGKAWRLSLAGRGRIGPFSRRDIGCRPPQVIASDHKARTDIFEAFAFPQR